MRTELLFWLQAESTVSPSVGEFKLEQCPAKNVHSTKNITMWMTNVKRRESRKHVHSKPAFQFRHVCDERIHLLALMRSLKTLTGTTGWHNPAFTHIHTLASADPGSGLDQNNGAFLVLQLVWWERRTAAVATSYTHWQASGLTEAFVSFLLLQRCSRPPCPLLFSCRAKPPTRQITEVKC